MQYHVLMKVEVNMALHSLSGIMNGVEKLLEGAQALCGRVLAGACARITFLETCEPSGSHGKGCMSRMCQKFSHTHLIVIYLFYKCILDYKPHLPCCGDTVDSG